MQLSGLLAHQATEANFERYAHRIAIAEKLFVPSKSLACPLHNKSDAWIGAYNLVEGLEMDFKQCFLEEMFDLLTSPSLGKMGSMAERKYS